MTMDLSFWKNKAPRAVIKHTLKQYHKRFLWRMVVEAEAGRLILDSNDVYAALATRQANAKNRANHWYYSRRDAFVDRGDPDHLQTIRDIKDSYGDQIRVRIEEPWAQFYTEDEQTMQSIAKRLNAKYIQSVNGPRDEHDEQLLRDGCIITRSPKEYGYKVFFRDRAVNSETRQQILNYLTNLGDTVRITQGSIDMLKRPYSHIWGVYIFTQDPDVLVFLQLIDPKLISNIHKFVYAP